MSPPAENSVDVSHSLERTVSISSNVLVVAIIFSFVLVLFFVVIYLCHSLRRRRSRHIFAAPDPVTFHHRGLDAAILRDLPITVFKVDSEEEIECSVCLCKLSDGEEVRMLPKCNHGFHLLCIDIWFHSHSTCPLCRSPIGLPVPVSQGISAPEPVTAESTEATIPRNKLFSGTEPSSSASASLVIDIPRRVMQGFSSSPSTPIPTSDGYENQLMATTPTSARLRTLTRLLSRGKGTMGASSAVSPRETEDIEQGPGLLRGAVGESRQGVTPRIPRNS